MARLHGLHHVPSTFGACPQALFGISFPGEILWVLQRARIRERNGDINAARLDYARVVNAWKNGDEAVQPAVERARDALARLVVEQGP